MTNITRHYLMTAFWSSTDERDGEPLSEKFDIEDIAPGGLAQAERDCALFAAMAGSRIDERGTAQAGHDFWLTRNGHGSGFWDGGWPEHGDALTTIAKTFDEVLMYAGDDERIYQF